jgi:hypothetical protein
LKSDALVEVTVGGQKITPEKVEAGTGFYEQRFAGPEVKPAMGAIPLFCAARKNRNWIVDAGQGRWRRKRRLASAPQLPRLRNW